jgi:hypothetical protein
MDGEDGVPGPPGPATPPTVYTARNDAGVSIAHELFKPVVSKTVPAGAYAINAKVDLTNLDDNDVGEGSCLLFVGGTTVDTSADHVLDQKDEVSSSDTVPLQGVTNFNGGDIQILCSVVRASDRVDATQAVITAIKTGPPQ